VRIEWWMKLIRVQRISAQSSVTFNRVQQHPCRSSLLRSTTTIRNTSFQTKLSSEGRKALSTSTQPKQSRWTDFLNRFKFKTTTETNDSTQKKKVKKKKRYERTLGPPETFLEKYFWPKKKSST
jgi:hypothetical protein